MGLTIHHLNKSQSERIVWLCEELEIPYTLVKHDRDPVTILAPKSLKDLHPAGTAPLMCDDPSPTTGSAVWLAESGAIVDYIIAVHGDGRLAATPRDKIYPEYVNWFHYANGSLQPTIIRVHMLQSVGGEDSKFSQFARNRLDVGLQMLEKRLAETKAYLAGPELTAADIMTIFTLTTMRGFCPIDLGAYPAILEYLQRVGSRPGYKRAMAKGDPGMEPLLGPKVKPFAFGQNKKPQRL